MLALAALSSLDLVMQPDHALNLVLLVEDARGHVDLTVQLVRRRSEDGVRNALLELLEVAVEEARKMVGGLVVRGAVRPGVARQQNVRGHARHLCGYVEAKALVVHELCALQLSLERGVEQRARVLNGDAVALAVASRHPARVEHPHLRAGLAQLGCQHVGVLGRMARHEGRAEARAEGGGGLLDAHLGTCHLAGVAADEVVGRLLGREAAERRQHAEGVARQEYHVLGRARA
mmetsp:Transcript_8592/g.26560  ORF Transcript_8592/g.26560 Transcript_8592/m.26560 type:complete len:233 (-) Transcript_8592:1156-1854(-)